MRATGFAGVVPVDMHVPSASCELEGAGDRLRQDARTHTARGTLPSTRWRCCDGRAFGGGEGGASGMRSSSATESLKYVRHRQTGARAKWALRGASPVKHAARGEPKTRDGERAESVMSRLDESRPPRVTRAR